MTGKRTKNEKVTRILLKEERGNYQNEDAGKLRTLKRDMLVSLSVNNIPHCQALISSQSGTIPFLMVHASLTSTKL